MKVINKYISVSDKVNNESGEIYIYGNIVDQKWFDEDVTPKAIRDALKELGPIKNIDVHLNSYGGSCVAGNAIINLLDSYKRKNNATVTVYIEGIAASMGSGIASVGDKVYMAANSLYMLHLPLTLAYGNKDELQEQISLLEKVEDTLVSNYMRRFTGTEDELRSMMADETWLTAEEAKEYGFVDEIIEGVNVAASAKGIKIGDQIFENKVADMIKNKYPNIKIEKEEKNLTYDESLSEYGITQDMFESFGIAIDKVLEIINLVKDSVTPEPVASFMDKEQALSELGCSDITAEEVLNYAKAGMHPVDATELSNKASEYDKIVSAAKDTAMTWAQKAQGESFNESRMKKYIGALDYSEIVDQTEEWKAQAKEVLHGGKRVSAQIESVKPVQDNNVKNDDDISNYQFNK